MSNKILIVAVLLTIVVTFYSLSEVHHMHSLPVQSHEDTSSFATRDIAASVTPLPSHTVDTGRKSVEIAAGSQFVSPPPLAAAVAVKSADSSRQKCYTYEHTELWGDVVVWGTQFKTNTAGECCDACRRHKQASDEDPECNVWVWCGDAAKCGGQHRECWLKHLAHPEASKPARQGSNVSWTSGTMDVDLNADTGSGKPVSTGQRKFHIITSAQGMAVHWQCRIHYYWYKKIKAQCEKEGPCDMGGFTRLLHSGSPDDLMDEIPTVVVNPLPQDMVEHSWYVVLNRPYAFVQWVQLAKIPEKYVLMSEPDHVFLRPLPNFMRGDTPAAFPFFYIEPANRENAHITRKFVGQVSRRELEKIAPIGNSPTYMTMDDMKKVMPVWMNVSIAVFKDQEANKVWGWVQEMYGFTIACYNVGIKEIDLFLHMMAQPPWDDHMLMAPGKPFYILHYTYGMDYKLTGEFMPGQFGEWRFDKRTFSSRPPVHLEPPPKTVKNELVQKLIEALNEGMQSFPCWAEYAKTGKIPKSCDSNSTATAAAVATTHA